MAYHSSQSERHAFHVLQAGADEVWANDLDSRNAHVILRNLSRCLNDWEPRLVTPLPALHRPVVELSSSLAEAGPESEQSASTEVSSEVSSDPLDAEIAAAQHAPRASASHAGEATLPACDQSPAAMFYQPSDSEADAQCVPPPSHGVGDRGAAWSQRARVSHVEGT